MEVPAYNSATQYSAPLLIGDIIVYVFDQLAPLSKLYLLEKFVHYLNEDPKVTPSVSSHWDENAPTIQHLAVPIEDAIAKKFTKKQMHALLYNLAGAHSRKSSCLVSKSGTDQATVSTPASALPEPMPKRARVDNSLESFASSELSSRNEAVSLTSAEPQSNKSSLQIPHCSYLPTLEASVMSHTIPLVES
jgi:hypothetical protein